MTTKKNKSGFTTMVVRLILLGTSFFTFINNFSALIKFKARQAGMDLITLLVLSGIIVTLLFSTWLCLQGLLFLFLISLQWSLINAMIILFLVNLILFIIIACMMCKVKNKLLAVLSVNKQSHEIDT